MDGSFLLDTFGKLMAALPLTLEVWALSMLFGGAIAAGVTALRLLGGPVGARVARAYVFVFRGSPLLVQLFFVYYGLASIAAVRASVFWPFLRDAFDCAVLALSLCTAAYQSEIFRGALAAVPAGEVEAGVACGMSRTILFARVIFPVASRIGLPAYATEAISMTKATALVSLVTLWDVTSVALKIRDDTYVTYAPILVAGAIYLALNATIGFAFARLEAALTPPARA